MILLIVLSGFILSIFTALIFKLSKKYAGIIISLLPLSIFIYLLTLVGEVSQGNYIVETWNWFPAMGINQAFLLDGLGLSFALIISGIGFAVFLYASKYMEGHKDIVRFYVYILVFMASMLGTVTADNMLALFVYWELTSISSFLLIGFNHHTERSRFSALQALLVTGAGGLALLAGLVLLSTISGSYEISTLKDFSESIHSSHLYTGILILVLAGAFTKSAQFPFHFWLPNAMEAPTPVSAYLHSATMVKAGVYLLARFAPSVGGTELWFYSVGFFGAATMLIGASLALKQTDLKRLLAYSTVSVLGVLTMLIGIGTELAINAMILYLIAHSLYKGGLFLYAGIIDHETGTRHITEISGLKAKMPISFAIGLLAILSMTGIIPFVGFIGKEALYEASLNLVSWSALFFGLTFISSIFLVCIAFLVVLKPMLGNLKYLDKKPHDPPFEMWFGPIMLGIIGLGIGIASSYTIKGLSFAAAENVMSVANSFDLHLWHGFNLIFLLSLVTLALGYALYHYWDRLKTSLDKHNISNLFKPSEWYKYSVDGMMSTAKWQTKFLQNGYLRYYILTIMVATLVFVGYGLFKYNDLTIISPEFDLAVYDIILGITLISGTILTVVAKGRLTAVASLGIVGFCVAVLFLLYGAPDLAMTQFSIETLSVILFVLVIYKLPKFLPVTSKLDRSRDVVIALLTGALMTLIVLFVTSFTLDSDLKSYFAENSYTLAKGKNIVNVILVDFRAIDTMGEITVLGVAAIGVFALIKLRKKTKLKQTNEGVE